MCLGESADSIVSLAIDGSFLYGGKRYEHDRYTGPGHQQKLRVIKAHDGDVMALQMSFGLLWSASTTGTASVSLCIPLAKRGCLREALPRVRFLTGSRNTARCTTGENLEDIAENVSQSTTA